MTSIPPAGTTTSRTSDSDNLIQRVNGFKARFDLFIGDECATRSGFYYHCPITVERFKSSPSPWQINLQPAATPHFPLSFVFDLTLSNMTLLGENFISAGMMIRDPYGQPLTAMQIVKFWIRPKLFAAKDDMISSVDELSMGYWRYSFPKPQPAVLVTYLHPYFEV